ncbi:MAG: peptidase S9 [Candidatus Aminicenantales bacterium]
MNSLFKSRYILLFLTLLLSTAVTVSTLGAQYFGRNKVQYQSFKFMILKSKHFDIYFYPKEREAAEIAARLAERWYARLARIFNHRLKGRQPLILYASSADFQQTTAIPGVIGEGTGGVTEMLKRRIVLPLGASLAEIDHVIGHELVHAFQFDITSERGSQYANNSPTMERVPLWFIEGLAEYLSIGPVDPNTSMWMRDASYRQEIPQQIKKLANTYRYFPYRYGQALWAYITGKYGDEKIASLMKAVGRIGDYRTAFKKVLGVSEEELAKEWREATKKAYEPLVKKTFLQDKRSRLLVKGTEMKRLNVSPSFSPDGKRLVFLSSRDLFSIEMYLADARTGKIKRKITKTALNPHFESLQFIKSSGSWDAEGKRFVFGAISRGKPVLSILNVDKNRIEKEIRFKELGEILNPTWSPDGRRIAFSSLAGGLTDLFIYDLNEGKLRRMTADAYADLYPAWSPDGRFIVFVTDRFSTDFSILNIGYYELALLNPESGEIKKIQAFTGAKHINPQWSPDSKSIYFISDVNGISNVYRKDLETNRIFQVTNFYTGVSGITALSPAMSVASKSGKIAFSVYDSGNNSIYTIESEEAIKGSPKLVRFGEFMPSVLPPRKKPEGALIGLLRNPLFGLPEEVEFEVHPYQPKLSLDYVSPPNVAIGVDRWGTYGGGGMTLFWSDMIGYHTVATMAQVSNRLVDSAALFGYMNTRYRLNWGAVVQRIPYVTGGYYTVLGDFMGEPAIIEIENIFRQINYEVSGFASYPFSQVNRIELSAGYRYLDFDREIRTRYYSMFDRMLLYREIEKLPAPDGIHMAFAGVALVYDSSYFGATSPILGQSYRLEYSPTLGTLNYSSILADYRRYFMPVKPFTFAFRMLHYGRYGRDAEDSRLWPLFIGYDGLIRGYSLGSFKAQEFLPGKEFPYENLFGSKILVANFELRFPLFGLLGIGKGFYGVFPLDFNAFYDVGLAWESDNPNTPQTDERAWFLGGDRKPLSSVGFGVRANLFGLIFGLYYVRPLERPERGWYLQFTFVPGF